jgi:hypothetical protein
MRSIEYWSQRRPGRRRRFEGLGRRAERDVVVLECLNYFDNAGDGATQTVQSIHEEHIELSFGCVLEHSLEARTMIVRSRLLVDVIGHEFEVEL